MSVILKTYLKVTTDGSAGDFTGDVSYTGGSLMGNLTGGSIVGYFTGTHLDSAELGPVSVVPVPAAVWLFGSGLIGLMGMAYRKV